MENKEVILGRASTVKTKKSKHTPSRIQADTLFTFTTELDHIIPTIKERIISPRYCEEDIRYLKIPKLKKIAYPMKCFCDINLHRLEEHLEWYGYYGLAFEKEWGMAHKIQPPKLKKIAYPMKCFCDINLHRLEEHLEWYGYYGLAFEKEWGMAHKIQPIQYINIESDLRKDFTEAFSAALKVDTKKESRTQLKMKSFLLHEMMYYKPYEGKFKNRNTGKIVKKCFTDECEWRFIPDVTKAGYEQVYFDKNILNAGNLSEISNSMFGIREISLEFEYADIKYIIVKSIDDFDILVREIESMSLNKLEAYNLISKIMIWDVSKGDF